MHLQGAGNFYPVIFANEKENQIELLDLKNVVTKVKNSVDESTEDDE